MLPSAVRGGGVEELLEDCNDEEHGDDDGGNNEAEAHRVGRVVLELAPAAAVTRLQR